MSANWQSISSSPSIDEAWASWKTVFFGIVHDYIPSKLVSSPRRQLPWMSDSPRTLIKQKHAAFRQLKLSPTDQHNFVPSEIKSLTFSAKRNVSTFNPFIVPVSCQRLLLLGFLEVYEKLFRKQGPTPSRQLGRYLIRGRSHVQH